MRVYTATTEIAAVAAAQTLLTVAAPADQVLVLLRAWISQLDLVVSEMLKVQIQRASVPGTGTAILPERHATTDSTFGGTVLEDHSVEPTFTGRELENEQFNVLNGWIYVPMPEDRIWIPRAGILGLRLATAPSAATTISAALVFGEVG